MSDSWSIEITNLVEALKLSRPPAGLVTRIIAIDGLGGAGKSTLARQLAATLGGVPVVPTDDFASWDDPIDWWPRMLDQVLRPIALGQGVQYQRYDWKERRLADWVQLPPRLDTVILEGVTASRSEFDEYLTFRIWVAAPRDLRLRRGLERDGDGMRAQWQEWMAAEDAYVSRDDPVARANVVISGAV
jgi:uridine kinase